MSSKKRKGKKAPDVARGDRRRIASRWVRRSRRPRPPGGRPAPPPAPVARDAARARGCCWPSRSGSPCVAAYVIVESHGARSLRAGRGAGERRRHAGGGPREGRRRSRSTSTPSTRSRRTTGSSSTWSRRAAGSTTSARCATPCPRCRPTKWGDQDIVHTVTIPVTGSPALGRYPIFVGLYDPPTGARLQIVDPHTRATASWRRGSTSWRTTPTGRPAPSAAGRIRQQTALGPFRPLPAVDAGDRRW